MDKYKNIGLQNCIIQNKKERKFEKLLKFDIAPPREYTYELIYKSTNTTKGRCQLTKHIETDT